MIKTCFSIWKRIVINVRSYGVVSTVRLLWMILSKMIYVDKRDYNFTLLPPAEPTPAPLPEGPLRLTWFIPDFDIGSGGHTTIFRIINLLQQAGHQSDVVVIPPTKYTSGEKMKQIVADHFISGLKGDFYIWGDTLPKSNALVATSWHTAYYVAATPVEGERFYFVQDFEPLFSPMGSEYLFAENSYRLGLKCIAASPWLARLMSERYGARAGSFLLGYSPEQYYRVDKPRRQKTVAFYARHLTPRRGFELGSLALELVKQADPEVEVILFGANAYPELPFDCTCRGVLGREELLALYQEVTVGLVLSLTNYSLIPNEMMACGLPVVDLDTECLADLYENGVDITLALPTPQALASAILGLLRDPAGRERIAGNAYRKVTGLSWEKSAQRIHELMRSL